MTWNYRVVKKRLSDGTETFGIHEVYYDADGKVNAYTEVTMAAYGETLEEFREDIKRHLEALERPVLTQDDLESVVRNQEDS